MFILRKSQHCDIDGMAHVTINSVMMRNQIFPFKPIDSGPSNTEWSRLKLQTKTVTVTGAQ